MTRIAMRATKRVNKKGRRGLTMHQHRVIEIVALLEFFAFAAFVFLFDRYCWRKPIHFGAREGH